MSKNSGTPNTGATQPARKHSDCDSAITDAKVLKATSEKAQDAPENVGAAARAIATQLMRDQIIGTSSSGKKRPAAVWGVSEPGNKK